MSIKALSLGSAGSAADMLIVSGATNATPIVITLAANHGLKDDDQIAIAGVTGNTGANGRWALKFTGTNTAQLVGSIGNGAFGGTVRVGVYCNRTPLMQGHSAVMVSYGNLVGTVDIEAYASYADFVAGSNNDGAIAPAVSGSGLVNSAGSSSTPAKSTITRAVTNAGIEVEMKLQHIMRAVVTAYTSGTDAYKLLG